MRQLMTIVLMTCMLTGCATVRAQQPLEDVFDQIKASVVTLNTLSRAIDATSGDKVLAASTGLGSGVLIDTEGHIMTAAHVVQTADAILVTLADGSRIEAEVISSDPMVDLALVKLKQPVPPGVAPATLADSDQERIGSRVFVVGSPRGISHTLTVGYLSARRTKPRQLDGLIELEVFQTDAAVNPGNSGGPMFNMNGEVIGIVSYIVSRTGSDEGLGFAITSNVARQVLLEQAPFWSGLDTAVLSGATAAAFNIPQGRGGLLVQRVARQSAGEAMGLRGGTIAAKIGDEDVVIGGDIILEVDGMAIVDATSILQIRRRFADATPGQTFTLTILRGGTMYELSGKFGG